MSDFYGSRIAAFQQVKDSAFADLYFRSEVSGNPLVLKLRGQSLRMLRLSLSSPGMINLGSIRLVQPGATDPIELDGLARVDFSSQYLHETAAARGVTAFLRGKSTHASVHTRLEKRPWINIDLGKNHRIDKLLLNNRDDEWAGRSWGLRIDGKAEGRNFLPLYNHPQREIEFALRVG